MEWVVFGVISALVAFVIAIITPIIKLNTIITELNVTVRNLSSSLDELKSGSNKVHEAIFMRLNEIEKRLDILEQVWRKNND